jgi:hypothetical protein
MQLAAHLFSLLPFAPLHPPLQVTLGTLRAEPHLAAPDLREFGHSGIISQVDRRCLHSIYFFYSLAFSFWA